MLFLNEGTKPEFPGEYSSGRSIQNKLSLSAWKLPKKFILSFLRLHAIKVFTSFFILINLSHWHSNRFPIKTFLPNYISVTFSAANFWLWSQLHIACAAASPLKSHVTWCAKTTALLLEGRKWKLGINSLPLGTLSLIMILVRSEEVN